MPSRHKRKTKSLVSKAAELAFAAPQVVAQRVTRMAIAGPSVSEHDRKEFQSMGAEKTSAFFESWNAMTMQAIPLCQSSPGCFLPSFLRSFWAEACNCASGASASAKRLARTKLR